MTCGRISASLALSVLAGGLSSGLPSAHGGTGVAPRLQGAWKVTGRFVLVENLFDRRVGDRVNERWSFRPRCRTGPCAVVLRRNGRSTLLRRTGSTYRGTERFTGAFRCGNRTYPRGTAYVAQWVIRVTRSRRRGGQAMAVRFSGAGATVGRSTLGPPCPTIVSKEGVTVSGARTD